MKHSFIPSSLQAVRGALQPTVSVPKQKTQMNKLTVFCQQVRRIGKSQKQREKAMICDKICFKITFQTIFQPAVELHKKREQGQSKVDKDFAVAVNRKLEVLQWLSANRRDGLWIYHHRMEAQISVPFSDATDSRDVKQSHIRELLFCNYKSLLSETKWFDLALLVMTGRVFWSSVLKLYTHGWEASGLSCHHQCTALSRARSQKVKSPFWSFCLMLRTILACPWCSD